MKTRVLLASAGSSGLATLLAVVGTLLPKVHDEQSLFVAGRFFALAGIFGLFGVALFFVGLALQKD